MNTRTQKKHNQNKQKTDTKERKTKCEQSVEDMTPQPKKSFVEALRGLMSEYTDTKQTQPEQPKNEDGPQRGAGNISYRGKGPANGRKYVKKTGPWPPQTMKKRKTYRKNRHKLNHNLCMTYAFFCIQ